jgi:hypothetical protein
MPCMKPEGILSCSKHPAHRPILRQLNTLYLTFYLSSILSLLPWSRKWSSLDGFHLLFYDRQNFSMLFTELKFLVA